MMSIEEIGLMLDMLEANYGESFYRGTNKKNVLKTWAVQFAHDDPKEVAEAVRTVINTCEFRPNISHIRRAMAAAKMAGQLTEIEAFRLISEAVNKTYGWESAVAAFNELPPILRKLTGTPNMLQAWAKVDAKTFQSVNMSAIRASYKELKEQEAEYYALPKDLRESQQWRIAAPEIQALPEPKHERTVSEMLDDMDRFAREYREKYSMTANPAYDDRVTAFREPLTPEEQKIIERKMKGIKENENK